LVNAGASRRDAGIVIGIAAGVGGGLGLVLAPAAAWLLMRHVAIGRALAETALGSAVGAFLGFLLTPATGLIIPYPPLTLALFGFTAAAVRLRVMHRKKGAVAILPSDE
jgi:hypothetical protein